MVFPNRWDLILHRLLDKYGLTQILQFFKVVVKVVEICPTIERSRTWTEAFGYD